VAEAEADVHVGPGSRGDRNVEGARVWRRGSARTRRGRSQHPPSSHRTPPLVMSATSRAHADVTAARAGRSGRHRHEKRARRSIGRSARAREGGHQPPITPRRAATGRPITPTRMRGRMRSSSAENLRRGIAEASMRRGSRFGRSRAQRVVDEHEFRITPMPEQEVREPELAQT